MATAIHNIEGDARLSEYDGTGGLVANAADDVAGRTRGDWGTGSYTCSGSPSTLVLGPIYLEANLITRVEAVPIRKIDLPLETLAVDLSTIN